MNRAICVYFATLVLLCNTAFGDYFVPLKNEPPTLEESLSEILKVDCAKVTYLKGITPNSQFKNKEASARCMQEQRFLRAIIDDDARTYNAMLKKGEWNRYFLFYTSKPPRLEITPLMVAIVFHSSHVFERIVSESGPADILASNPPRFNINRMISDEHGGLGAFKLGDRIYNVNGVSALDLAAMYHRYDMFWTLLQHGAIYNSPKYPQTNGIITLGDVNILELMLQFDGQFLQDFGGGGILHYVAREGNVELLEYLITHKNIPIDVLKAGETPLDAALNGKNFQHKPQLEIAKKLLELGAKPSQANQHRLQKLMPKEEEE